MNRREALGVMTTAGLCPTAAMAIPEQQENPDSLRNKFPIGSRVKVVCGLAPQLLGRHGTVTNFDNNTLHWIADDWRMNVGVQLDNHWRVCWFYDDAIQII